MNKANNSFTTRKVNKIYSYQQVQDQDFRTLSNFNKENEELNQSDSFMLDRLRGEQKRSPTDIRSVLSTSWSLME